MWRQNSNSMGPQKRWNGKWTYLSCQLAWAESVLEAKCGVAEWRTSKKTCWCEGAKIRDGGPRRRSAAKGFVGDNWCSTRRTVCIGSESAKTSQAGTSYTLGWPFHSPVSFTLAECACLMMCHGVTRSLLLLRGWMAVGEGPRSTCAAADTAACCRERGSRPPRRWNWNRTLTPPLAHARSFSKLCNYTQMHLFISSIKYSKRRMIRKEIGGAEFF